MDLEKFERIKELVEKINQLESEITTLTHVVSDAFHERKIFMNVLDTQQNEGYVSIPKSIMKTVCKITLNECKVILAEYKRELENS